MLTIRKRVREHAVDPTHDRRGYRRSPVTLSSYRRGTEPANKGRKFPAEPLTGREVRQLLKACGRDTAGNRNRALIVIYWRCGLRNAEALALAGKDVDLDRGTVTVLHGKGNRRRVVAIDQAAVKLLRPWEAERRRLGFGDADPFIPVLEGPTRGREVQQAYPRNLLKRLAEKAEIAKRVHPHGLRHTYAASLLDAGVPIHYIKRMLGHSSIAITEHYADHVRPARVLQVLRELEWPD